MTATPVPTPAPTPAPSPPPPPPRVNGLAFVLGLLAAAGAGAIGCWLAMSTGHSPIRLLASALWGLIGGLAAYVLYGLGWLPGASWLQRGMGPWGAAIVAFVGGSLPLLVRGWQAVRAAENRR